MGHQKYNGHWNYETFVVAQDYELFIETIQEIYEKAEDTNTLIFRTKLQNAVYDLQYSIKEYYLEELPELSSPYSELLEVSLQNVNYYELAEGWINDYIENVEYEKKHE